MRLLCRRKKALVAPWQITAHIGTKVPYLPNPDPHVWVVPISRILGRLPLMPLGDTGIATCPRYYIYTGYDFS